MTLEQAIQSRWADDVTLAALVPSERLFTSFAPADTARPRVVVERRKTTPKLRGSGGLRAELVELAFTVDAANYDEAAVIGAAVADAFDGVDFDAGEVRVAAMRWSEERRARSAGDAADREAVRWELVYEVVVCS